jgi:hypothetical protein
MQQRATQAMEEKRTENTEKKLFSVFSVCLSSVATKKPK